LVEINKQFPYIHFNGAKPEPKQAFPDALKEIDDFADFVKKQKCPKCKEKEGFHIKIYQRGHKGDWECAVWCNCGVQGILNDTGFHFNQLSEQTQTRAEVKRKKR
jgi:hypothetical protein